MNLKNYLLLCKLSTYFFNHKKFWYVKYYNFFHPIKFHPAHTKYYDVAYGNEKLRETFILKIFNYFKNSLVELISFQNCNLSKTKYETCIISHIISDEKKYTIENDLYFKGFYKKLKNSFVVYRNLTLHNSSYIKKKIVDKDTIVVNQKSFFLLELYYLIFTLFIFINVKIDSFFEIDKAKKKFLNEGSKFIYVGNSISNLRIYHQVLKIVKLYKPKNIFITFEGNAWEKILMYKLRKKFKNIKFYGYQFTSLNTNHGILNIKLKKEYYPNQIMTVGKINCDLLKNSKISKNVPIKVVGTAKYLEPKKIKKFVKTCLILPGENKHEFYKFFELTEKLAEENKDFKFIFRIHPQRDLKYYFKKKYIVPKNIRISKEKFDDDVKKSFFAIYGGSSAIINCLSQGLWPLYYSYSEINVDVIFKLKLNNRIIKNSKDFNKLINRNYFKKNFYKIPLFYKNYYQELNLNK